MTRVTMLSGFLVALVSLVIFVLPASAIAMDANMASEVVSAQASPICSDGTSMVSFAEAGEIAEQGLIPDPSGVWWVIFAHNDHGGYLGVASPYRGDQVEICDFAEGPIFSAEVLNGELWLLTGSYQESTTWTRVNDAGWVYRAVLFESQQPANVTALDLDPQGNVLAATDQGFAVYLRQRNEWLARPDLNHDGLGVITDLALAPDGELLVATGLEQGFGLYRFVERQWLSKISLAREEIADAQIEFTYVGSVYNRIHLADQQGIWELNTQVFPFLEPFSAAVDLVDFTVGVVDESATILICFADRSTGVYCQQDYLRTSVESADDDPNDTGFDSLPPERVLFQPATAVMLWNGSLVIGTETGIEVLPLLAD